MNNKAELVKTQQEIQNKVDSMPIGQFTNQASIRNRAINMLGNDRAIKFLAGITSAVSTNPALQECTNTSIFNGALLGESLNLSPSPQLGQYFLVPYKKKDKKGNVISITAQFQIGYKGYIQLAIRSGQYKKINVAEVKEGEFLGYDPFNEEVKLNPFIDYIERKTKPVVGYYAMFEYLNGFKKCLYMTKEEMLDHADTYSSAFSKNSYEKLLKNEIPQSELYKYSSFWYKNFDEMAKKTMIRQLISKWGIMSAEMQQAYEMDMAELKENGDYDYIDIPEVKEPSNSEKMDIPNADITEDSPKDDENKETKSNAPKQVDMNALFNN